VGKERRREVVQSPVRFEILKHSVRMVIPKRIVEAMGGIEKGTIAIVIYDPATPKTLKVKIH